MRMPMCSVVLNASRHHRVARGRWSASSSAAKGAQRLSASPRRSGEVVGHRRPLLLVLNASRHHRVARAPTNTTPPATPAGAQRLSASPRRSGGKLRRTSPVMRRCSTPLGITASLGGSHVFASASSSSCSTPLGITASLGAAHWRQQRRDGEVLNASRHHRVARVVPDDIGQHSVRVLNASRHHRVARGSSARAADDAPRAQRLSASPRRSG